MLKLRSQSFRRYRLHGPIPSPDSDAFVQRLRDRKFEPLTANEERTFGWVSADNLLVTDFEAGAMTIGTFAAFALRIDRRRVNAKLLRAHMDLEVRARYKAAADGAGPARITRDEKRDMRKALHDELLRQTNPSIESVAVLLHTKRKVAYVLSLARQANELVQMHFIDTFGAELLPMTPWRRGAELLEGSPLADQLDHLHRTEFGSTAAATDPVGRSSHVPASHVPASPTGPEAGRMGAVIQDDVSLEAESGADRGVLDLGMPLDGGIESGESNS